jgi:hypothetical protein
MPRLRSLVFASFATAVALGGVVPAFAGRQVHGGDVARVLAGRFFSIVCFDGTRGRGEFGQHGAVSVSYRRPSTPNGKPDEFDLANVRVRGVEICLSWKQFGGGGDGCYPVFEQAAGRYRLGNGLLWCEISAK